MPDTVTIDLTGIWTYDQRQVLDDKAAIKLGHVDATGKPGLHGSFTKVSYYVIRAEDSNRTLILFDEDGGLTRFDIVPGTEQAGQTWRSSKTGWACSFAEQAIGNVKIPAKTKAMHSCLQLDKYTADDHPSNAEKGDYYI